MCGRFASKATKEQIEREFKTVGKNPAVFAPRYNIAPSQRIGAVLAPGGERIFSNLKWGLVPSWAKDPAIGNRMINARAETLSEKPSFRDAFKKRRCIVPASGFYEWDKKGNGAGTKQPFYFYLKEREVFGFAGLYEEWLDRATGEVLETCTIITTEANEVLEPVHDRMPVILKANDYEQWLDAKETDSARLANLLVPFPAEEMDSHPVSRAVNSPSADSPELIVNSK